MEHRLKSVLLQQGSSPGVDLQSGKHPDIYRAMETDTARLIEELKHARGEQRLAAVKRLGASDCLNADAFPPLIAALNDAERDVPQRAAHSLQTMGMGGPTTEEA